MLTNSGKKQKEPASRTQTPMGVTHSFLEFYIRKTDKTRVPVVTRTQAGVTKLPGRGERSAGTKSSVSKFLKRGTALSTPRGTLPLGGPRQEFFFAPLEAPFFANFTANALLEPRRRGTGTILAASVIVCALDSTCVRGVLGCCRSTRLLHWRQHPRFVRVSVFGASSNLPESPPWSLLPISGQSAWRKPSSGCACRAQESVM